MAGSKLAHWPQEVVIDAIASNKTFERPIMGLRKTQAVRGWELSVLKELKISYRPFYGCDGACQASIADVLPKQWGSSVIVGHLNEAQHEALNFVWASSNGVGIITHTIVIGKSVFILIIIQPFHLGITNEADRVSNGARAIYCNATQTVTCM